MEGQGRRRGGQGGKKEAIALRCQKCKESVREKREGNEETRDEMKGPGREERSQEGKVGARERRMMPRREGMGLGTRKGLEEGWGRGGSKEEEKDDGTREKREWSGGTEGTMKRKEGKERAKLRRKGPRVT